MIIFLYGADSYRSRQKLNELKEKFIKEIDPLAQSLLILDGRTLTLSEFNEKAGSGSLFAKKHLLVIEDIFENKNDKFLEDLIPSLKKKPAAAEDGGDNIIIFLDNDLKDKNRRLKKGAKKLLDFLSQEKYAQEFKPLPPSQAALFIKNLAEQLKRIIKPAAITELLTRTDNDLWRSSHELKKLAFLIGEQSEINLELVKEHVTGSIDENIFALADAVSVKNKKLALKLLEEQYQAGLSEDYILAMLIRQFKILLQVKSEADKSNPAGLATRLQLHPFVIKKSLAQSQLLSLDDLKNNLNRLLAIDFNNKSGQGEIKASLSLFIMKL
jgi:DNA polymerase-3 subunit delta